MLRTQELQAVLAALEEMGSSTALGPLDEELVARVTEWFAKAFGTELLGEAGTFFMVDVALQLVRNLDGVGDELISQLRARGQDRALVSEVVLACINPVVPPWLVSLHMTGLLDGSLFVAMNAYPWQVASDFALARAELRVLTTQAKTVVLDEDQGQRVLDLVVDVVQGALNEAA